MVPLPPRNPDPMSAVMRQPSLWPWLSLLIAALGLTVVIVWQTGPGLLDLPSLRPRSLPVPSAVRPTVDERRQIRLFFPQASGETLREVDREIAHRASLSEEVRAVLRELAAGAPGVQGALSAGIEVRQVFLDAFGIVYLDFNKGFEEAITAPEPHPDRTISAIVTSLTTSFSEIKRVRFLVEGHEMTSAVGDWDLRRPVQPRFPGEEAPPILSQPQG